MPPKDRVGLHEQDRVAKVLGHGRESNHDDAVEPVQPWPLDLSLRDDELLTQQSVLEQELLARSESVPGKAGDRTWANGFTNKAPHGRDHVSGEVDGDTEHGNVMPRNAKHPQSCATAILE
jgi:hypothetical protein